MTGIATSVLIGAPALAVLAMLAAPRPRLAERLNLAAAGLCFIAAVAMTVSAPAAGARYLGRYLIVDPLGAWIILCAAVVYLLASIHACGYMRMPGEEARLPRFYQLFALFALTIFIAPLMNNPGLYWIAIEMTTVVSTFLVAFEQAAEAIEAGWKYIIIVSAGITLALLGTVIFYWAGTFSLGPTYDMTWRVLRHAAPHMDRALLVLGFLLVLVGYGTKVGLAPMHTWLPDAHSEGPAPVSAMLSGALLNCAMLGIVRYLVVLRATAIQRTAATALVLLGVLSLLVGALFITRQSVIKRLAAYSSVEHMGVVALGFGFGGPLGVIGALYHMLNHSLAKSLVFFGAGNMMHAYESKEIDRMRRVLRYFPRSGAIWLAGAVAITGAPPFGLFLSELTVLRAGIVGPNAWAVWCMGVLLVVIFIGFLARFRAMYFGPAPGQAPRLRLHAVHVLPMAAALAATLLLGLWWLPPLWRHLAAIAAQLGGA